MNKFAWIIGILAFIIVTIFVVSVDTSQSRRVHFSNQDFAITNEGNEVVGSSINSKNTNIKFSDSKISNYKVSASESKVNLKSSNVKMHDSSTFNDRDVNFKSKNTYSNKNMDFDNSDFDFDTQGTGFKNADPIDYKNLDTEQLESVIADAKIGASKPLNSTKKPIKQMHQEKYLYKNIDWSVWKSNFVNRILDDSMSIKSLDSYPSGSWFYYSFDVSSEGVISNIKVQSVSLSAEDRGKVVRLIKGYQYKDITRFPKNSKRKTAKVSAVMVLSNETQHSKPSDFTDLERIKLKVK